MSAARRTLSRQWVPIAGGSCDVRMGQGALEESSAMFRGAVGRPRLCAVVVEEGVDAQVRSLLGRQVADAGFQALWHEVPADAARTLGEAGRLADWLASEGITADDLCCAMGGADVLSLASFVCASWCGGMSLSAVPLDAVAFLEGALCPRGMDVAGRPEMLSTRACASHVLVDHDFVCRDPHDESSRYARVLMVRAAMVGSELEFSALWDSVGDLMSEDEDAFVAHLVTAAKTRGKVCSSTAAAVRQSLNYGADFAAALERAGAHEAAPSARLAEGMRFAARLSVALDKLSIDDMLAQDELLDAIDVPPVACDMDPARLREALREARFLRTNRFMLLVPHALGRVRLTTVDDDLLYEHVRAWCEARRG